MSSAACERGFSYLNQIKSDQRTHLAEQTTEDLMRIRINGPSLENFSPIPAIELWWEDSIRSRRPEFKRKSKEDTPLTETPGSTITFAVSPSSDELSDEFESLLEH